MNFTAQAYAGKYFNITTTCYTYVLAAQASSILWPSNVEIFNHHQFLLFLSFFVYLIIFYDSIRMLCLCSVYFVILYNDWQLKYKINDLTWQKRNFLDDQVNRWDRQTERWRTCQARDTDSFVFVLVSLSFFFFFF